MIFYSKERVDLLQQNVIVLADEREAEEEGRNRVATAGYIVLSKDVYDTAVILNERYAGNPMTLRRSFVNFIHEEAVDYFEKVAPKPLYILGEFLELVTEDIELPMDIECLCGYLHVMSGALDFNAYLTVPAEVRRKVNFTMSQLGMYEDEWKSLTLKLNFAEIDEGTLTADFVKKLVSETVSAVMEKLPNSVPMQPYLPPQYPQQYPVAPIAVEEEDEEVDLDDPFAGLDDMLVEAGIKIGEGIQSDGQENAEEETEEAAPAEEAPKETSVIDSIIHLYGGV